MMFAIVRRLECGGYLKQNDRRRGLVKEIVLHRNTVSDVFKKARPGIAADDLDATARWYRKPTDGSKPWRVFPYHFFIDWPDTASPIIYQVHPLDVKAPHASGRNASSVGVALNIDGRKRGISQQGELLIEWLLAVLLDACPGAIVSRHRDEGEFACPGDLVDVEGLALTAREMYHLNGGKLAPGSGILFSRGW